MEYINYLYKIKYGVVIIFPIRTAVVEECARLRMNCISGQRTRRWNNARD